MNQCLFCNENSTKIVFREFGVDYLRCKKCDHLFSSFERDAHYDGYFENIESEKEAFQYWDISHKKMYEAFAKRFMEKKCGNILDVGAGLGFFVKFAEEILGWDSYGVEISKEGCNFAKEKLNLNKIFCGRIEETDFEKESFDIITMWDVIEHLLEPRPVLKKCYELLKDEGFLFLHTPNGEVQLYKSRIKKIIFGEKEGIRYLEAKDHLNLYKEKTIEKLLKGCGFQEIKFFHLPPIQAIAGENDYLRVLLKNFWWISVTALYFLTLKNINLDNLFVMARKKKQ